MDRTQAAAVLGVPETATTGDVDRAYKQQARLLHPDRWDGSTQADRDAAAAAMLRLNDARRTLRRGAPVGPPTSDLWDVPPAEPRPLPDSTGAVLRVLATVREQAAAFADNPYALQAWLVLAAVALLTGVVPAVWLFLLLAAWAAWRQRTAAPRPS